MQSHSRSQSGPASNCIVCFCNQVVLLLLRRLQAFTLYMDYNLDFEEFCDITFDQANIILDGLKGTLVQPRKPR